MTKTFLAASTLTGTYLMTVTLLSDPTSIKVLILMQTIVFHEDPPVDNSTDDEGSDDEPETPGNTPFHLFVRYLGIGTNTNNTLSMSLQLQLRHCA